MPATTERDKSKTDPSAPQSSTTREISIYHSDDEDVFIIRIDAKDPVRQKVMAAIQSALEGTQPPRSEEASRFKAYAAEKLPDDWRRKSVSRGDPDATPEIRQPYAQQHTADKERDRQRDVERQRQDKAQERA
jgi:hypothetical protein